MDPGVRRDDDFGLTTAEPVIFPHLGEEFFGSSPI